MWVVFGIMGWMSAGLFLYAWMVTEKFRKEAIKGWEKSLEERRILSDSLKEAIDREQRTLLMYMGDRAIRIALIGGEFKKLPPKTPDR